ncbi:armadillo-type protein [Calycina marina]|uniref:Armadillo-type protein n=1 Tax=Calycina marina TaxID=1763456 RepID=A0A9P8CHX3_9HELO|nr:armadillo-type protein [Calycina marina]
MVATMEDQLLLLLQDTQSPAEGPRKQAELHLQQAQNDPAFPSALSAIASHASVVPEIRQQALLVLRPFVENNWSGQDENGLTIQVAEPVKVQLRNQLLELATSGDADRKVKSAASYVVSKIANVDFPEEWPSLLPTILRIIPNANDAQLHGALKVLADLVEDALSEDQFFQVARDIIKTVYEVALNEGRKTTLRALAVSVFRGCFDIMDMVKDEHGAEVKNFADEILSSWSPFFMVVLKKQLSPTPADGEEMVEGYKGLIALKCQVVKTLMKIRQVFPQLLLPQSPILFNAVWDELSLLQEPYKNLFVDNDAQGRMEDSDGLPYTLDYLVLEELDFFSSCLRAPPVQKGLEALLQTSGGVSSTKWALDVMKLAVAYAQIPKEDEEMWDIDVNLYLAEETSVTANYTARTACGDLLIKLGEWLNQGALEGLLTYTRQIFSTESAWRLKESALFLLTHLMNDFLDVDKSVTPDVAGGYFDLVEYAINQADEPLLRARGYLVAGVSVQSIPNVALVLLDRTIKGVNDDESEVVRVSCIKSLQGFMAARTVPADRQIPIVVAISQFLYAKDLTELEDADDLLVTLVETLAAAIGLDPMITISGDSGALDLLFLLAKHGAQNFQLTMLVTETFETIVGNFSGTEAYTALCGKVLPSLTGAFNVGDMTEDDQLVEVGTSISFTRSSDIDGSQLATELLAVLTENGTEPLPAGYVASSLPKLNRLLMATNEGGILRPGVEAIKYMLMYDHQQVFTWHDDQNRSGLEVCLIIIDRLLNPAMEDNSASEVGGLAAELVEKAGQERLGPFLPQLLKAVAMRLATAEAAPFIQSLILVFARLSLVGAQDVVQFLTEIDINGLVGLQVVLSKWLEHSVHFAGYDGIRQNVIALSKIYALNDPRVVQISVKGDLIIPVSSKIMTRSQTKKTPDQYTIVPANLKIIKVLIEELLSASGHGAAANAAAAAAAEFADEEADDDGWEDLPQNILDLGLGTTKAELMAFGEGQGSFMRQRDDETQSYLMEFFVHATKENIGGFNELHALLTDDEKAKLNDLLALQ